jgi:elongation factor G
VPICFCSAKTGAGAASDLMHVFASLLPKPDGGQPPPVPQAERRRARTVEFHAVPGRRSPLIAHIFKVTTDPFVGKLGVFRVHQGTIKAKQRAVDRRPEEADADRPPAQASGQGAAEVEALGPGDIGAIAKIDDIPFQRRAARGHESGQPPPPKPLPMPEPMYGLAVELKNHADETKFSTAAHKVTAEDPSLRLRADRGDQADRAPRARGASPAGGAGEVQGALRDRGDDLHAQDRVQGDHYQRGRGAPSPQEADRRGRAVRRGDAAGRAAAPDHETGFEFVNGTVGGSIPRQFMPAIEKGVRSVLSSGAVAGYPIKGVRVEVLDGKYHAVDSKEIAFITAGKRAFIDAVAKARPVLLEPFVTLEVTIPSNKMGDIAGDLSTKRGRVQDTRILPGDMCTVVAQAPLSELQTFSNELKSITGGAGSFTMEYSHDDTNWLPAA